MDISGGTNRLINYNCCERIGTRTYRHLVNFTSDVTKNIIIGTRYLDFVFAKRISNFIPVFGGILKLCFLVVAETYQHLLYIGGSTNKP